MPDTPDPRAEALSALVRDSEDQKLYDVPPEMLAKAAAELKRPATFADFLDRHREFAEALWWLLKLQRSSRPEQWAKDIDAARARLNTEAERLNLRW